MQMRIIFEFVFLFIQIYISLAVFLLIFLLYSVLIKFLVGEHKSKTLITVAVVQVVFQMVSPQYSA